MMRFIAFGLFAVLVVAYGFGAYGLYEQERWAKTTDVPGLHASGELRHPEALLALIRGALDEGEYSDRLLVTIGRALREAPSSYKSALFLAVFRANRLEDPAAIGESFEAAIRLFPANGRLHLTYAEWLLTPRPRILELFGQTRPASSTSADAREDADPRLVAEDHLRSAFSLDPDLVGPGLGLLRRRRVPAERWILLVPETLPARRRLVLALAGSGYRADALALLEGMLHASSDTEFFAQAANWAMQWGDNELALEAAERWRKEEIAAGEGGSRLARATLLVARIHMARKDSEAAYRTFRVALDEIEGRAGAPSAASLELLVGMGYVYLDAGQTVMALSLFSSATDVAPYHGPAFLGLARTHRRAGNGEAAVAQYRQALRLDPEDETAKSELEELLVEMALQPNDP